MNTITCGRHYNFDCYYGNALNQIITQQNNLTYLVVYKVYNL